MSHNFHHKELKEIYKELDTDPKNGLNKKEAEKRLDEYGINRLPKKRQRTLLQMLLDQVKSPLVYILFGGTAISLYLGEILDASVIFAAAVVSIAIGFWQEYKSENIFEKLSEAIEKKALVIRGGHEKEIDAEDLVPGDIVALEVGRDVPADCRLIEIQNLETTEASLTGESHPVKKEVGILSEDTPLADRVNMVFMGTAVGKGSGRAVVVSTGEDTEIGKIAEMVQTTKKVKTPLQEKMDRLAKVLSIFVLISAVVITAVGLFQARGLEEVLVAAIAVAVGAVPEGLVPAISVILAISANKILEVKGLVRRLVAAETLGSTSIICTDKTGTLTRGEMVVDRIITLDGDIYFSSNGINKNKTTVNDDVLEQIVKPLAFANESKVENPNSDIEDLNYIGRPTDNAVMEAAMKLGADMDSLLQKDARLAKLQFSSDWKYLASFNEERIYVAGAPEKIFDFSNFKDSKEEEIKKKNEELASKGFRLVAIGDKKNTKKEKVENMSQEELHKEAEKGLTFRGLVVIRDPVREEVKDALDTTRRAGIRPIIVTGDHLLTAKAVGEELGFNTDDNSMLEGEEMDRLSDEEFKERFEDIEIYARVTPEHKMRIIEAWQDKGEPVAMTGDGVNDAPALKKADIGIAVESGTDVTKEASDLVLLDNSFSVIKEAVKQGRVAFDNMRKTVTFLLADSFTELGLIMITMLAGTPLPITGVQILWINFIEDVLPGIALGFEPGEDDVMERKPVPKSAPLVGALTRKVTMGIAITAIATALGIFYYGWKVMGLDIELMRTLMLGIIGFNSMVYIFSIKSLKRPIWKTNFLNNKFLKTAVVVGLVLLAAAIYLPFLNGVLETVPLPPIAWLPIAGVALFQVIVVEIIKYTHNKNNNFDY